jgi:ATP-dependent helicase STH1/SNF2|tara:strand:+ start:950 stop:1369 length:420 start_codon:yes stop_codon:yes gene_type:complete
VDRQFYKRTKSYAQSKKEARTLDRFEQNMRSGQETRKKTRHKEFLNEILQHAKDFHEFHKKRQTQTKRKAIIFKNFLEHRAKKETKEKTMEDQKRKQLLRDNNFDDWIKLVNFEKNERLMEILSQTNNYIEELGQKVSI